MYPKMFTTKFTPNARFFGHIRKTSDYNGLASIYQYRCQKNLLQAHILMCTWSNPFNYSYRNDDICKSTITITSSFLKYSTEPIQIPPPKPIPSTETDEFGSLGGLKYAKIKLDAEELKDETKHKILKTPVPRKFKPTPGQYALMIKNYITKGDLKSAANVIQLSISNRDTPTPYMYTLLIRAFALQGDIKTCYKYYTDMKQHRYKIKENTYVSMFNACSNCPNQELALKYLSRIQDHMTKSGFKMNHAHYNVLVKAYGCNNKFEESMRILNEMIEKRMKIGISTLNSLMYAANCNKESGLKYVLYTWQFMRKNKISPDLFAYNLLLRAIRDTHFGDCSVNELLLPDGDNSTIITDDNRPDLLFYPPILSSLPLKNIERKSAAEHSTLSPTTPSNITFAKSLKIIPKNSEQQLQVVPSEIENLNLDAILRQNKLILFGGIDGLIEKMKNDRITPNVKTITYLMQLVPDSIAAENSVIKYAQSIKLPLDIDFYNLLIKKRAAYNSKAAKDVLIDISKANLNPNIVTYGVLAMACKSSNQGRELLRTLKTTGHSLNKFIAGTLMKEAFDTRDFIFVLELMEQILRERVRLDDVLYEKLDDFQQRMTHLVKSKHHYAESNSFKTGFAKFNMRYKNWQKEMGRKIVTERKSQD